MSYGLPPNYILGLNKPKLEKKDVAPKNNQLNVGYPESTNPQFVPLTPEQVAASIQAAIRDWRDAGIEFPEDLEI